MSSALPPCVAAAGLAAPAARAAARVPRVAARAPPPSRNCPASALSRHRVFSSASASSSATHARAARRGVRALGDAKDADDAEEDADDAEDVEDGVSPTARDSKSSVSGDETPSTKASFFAAYSRRVSALAAQVKDLGMAGMTAYGILNTLYYTLAFTTAWSFRAIPANLSLAAAFRVAGECMALVWAGSQVTKIARLGLAVAGAPKMDHGIKSVCAKTGWAYRNVFTCVVFGCFLGSAAFFSMLVVAKAALA